LPNIVVLPEEQRTSGGVLDCLVIAGRLNTLDSLCSLSPSLAVIVGDTAVLLVGAAVVGEYRSAVYC